MGDYIENEVMCYVANVLKETKISLFIHVLDI